ncbi:MAG TPA: amidohydrolase family protein [Candidatus Binatia bacterium]|jgi:predicted TIM-barrel fold metal-dependent hydrolase
MIIDTHFHAFPGKYLDRVPEQSANDPRGAGFHAFDHREYLDVMDRYGVDIGVLSNTGGRIEQGGDRTRALELCRILNDEFADAHAKHPRRFKAFARLPMLDMDAALREMERCYGELRMHGVMLPTNLAGKYLDEDFYEPFWTALVATGKPLFLHPANAPCQANWNRFSLHQKILWPTDTTLAVSRIVYSGVFDRHPDLRLIAAHLGGMLLVYPDRLNWREGKVECQSEPETYLKKIYYDTAGPIRGSFIKLACDTVGAGQILFGSDYPHGRGGRDDQFFPMTLRAMDELDLSSEDKDKIYYRNAKQLFGFAEG